MKSKSLGIAVSIYGNVFRHPGDGSPESAAADSAAKEREEYPYAHLYEGDNIFVVVDMLNLTGGEL